MFLFSFCRQEKPETSETSETVSSHPILSNYSSVKETQEYQPVIKRGKMSPPNRYIAPPNNSYIAPPNINIAPLNSYVAPPNSCVATQNRLLNRAQLDHSCYSSKLPPPPVFQKLEIAPINRQWQFDPRSYPTFNIFNNFSTFINDQNDSVWNKSTLTLE